MNNKQLADKLTTELTGILQYVVTDDIQHFSKDMRLNGDIYVPVVLSTVTSFENENRYIKTIVYQLRFKVQNELRDSFYTDIEDFKATQTTETIDSYLVTKLVQNPILQGSAVDNGIDYFDYTLEFTWTYALSKIGTNTVITIDSVAVPFVACDVQHDVSYVSNESSAVNYRMTNDVVIMTIPLIVANARVLSLYQDVNSDTYNKVYAMNIDGNVKSVVLKRGQYTFNNSAVITNMILTFETAYPRVTVEVDGDLIPVTAYQYMAKSTIDQSERTSDVQKGWANDKVRSWSITFVNNGSTAYNKLFADAYGDTLGITYTLDIGLASTFTVILAEAVERYTETGDMTLECQFVEYA